MTAHGATTFPRPSTVTRNADPGGHDGNYHHRLGDLARWQSGSGVRHACAGRSKRSACITTFALSRAPTSKSARTMHDKRLGKCRPVKSSDRLDALNSGGPGKYLKRPGILNSLGPAQPRSFEQRVGRRGFAEQSERRAKLGRIDETEDGFSAEADEVLQTRGTFAVACAQH